MHWEIAWYIPVLIFCARICDVSINTCRTMLVISGHRGLAIFLGFFEVMIWVIAAKFALEHLLNPFALIAYAGGFCTGVYVGMWLEQWIAMGFRMVQVISPTTDAAISDALREHGYHVTRVEGTGRGGPVEVAYSVIRRKQLPEFRATVAKIAPKAFMTVERVDTVSGGGGIINNDSPRFSIRAWERLGLVRK